MKNTFLDKVGNGEYLGGVDIIVNKIITSNTFYHYFLLMEKVRETFEKAWKGVIAPNKYQYNINTVCPREQLVDNHLI